MPTEQSWPCHVDPSTGFIYRDRESIVIPQPDGTRLCRHRHTDDTWHSWVASGPVTTTNNP